MGDASRTFTSDEAKSVCERYVAGESIAELAKAFSCSDVMIRNTLKRNNIERRSKLRKRLFSDEIEAEICRRYVAGDSSDALATAFSTNGRTILNILGRKGIEKRLSASAANPTVTAEQRQQIVEMCYEGSTLQEAADVVGVHKTTAFEIVRAAGVPMVAGKPRTCEVDDHAFDVLTPEALYWIGFLFADGCVHQDKVGSPKLAIGLAEVDRLHVEKLRRFLKSTHKILDRPARDSKPAFRGGPDIKTGPSVFFSVRSKHLCKMLVEKGIVKKRVREPVPEIAVSRHFWRGVVDGDGTIGVSNSRGYSYPMIRLPGQEGLITAFCWFLEQQNIRLKSFFSGVLWHVATMGSVAQFIIRLLYDDAAVALERKRVIAEALC